VCINNNKLKITNYFKQVKDKTTHSKTHINFLISLAKLCLMYPKFKLTSMSLDNIKNNMMYLRDRMPPDAEYLRDLMPPDVEYLRGRMPPDAEFWQQVG